MTPLRVRVSENLLRERLCQRDYIAVTRCTDNDNSVTISGEERRAYDRCDASSDSRDPAIFPGGFAQIATESALVVLSVLSFSRVCDLVNS